MSIGEWLTTFPLLITSAVGGVMLFSAIVFCIELSKPDGARNHYVLLVSAAVCFVSALIFFKILLL